MSNSTALLGSCILVRYSDSGAGVIYIRVRANLARYVVMSDYMRCRHAVFIHKVTGKLCRCLYCCVLKIPVFICCAHALCVFLPYAHFNTDTISVSALCVLIARRSAMPRYISVLYALPYLAVKSYKVMRRRISIAAAIISAVVLCAAQFAYIMDNNILNSGNAALIEIVLTYLSVNVHISCLSAYKISACGVPQALFAAMSLLFLSFLCPVFLYVACGAVPVQFVCVRQFVRILRQKLPHLFPYLFYGQPA